MPVDFDMFNLYKQKSISHLAEGSQSLSSKGSDYSQSLDLSDCSGIPLAGQSCYSCGDVEPIITSLQLLWIPLDVHLSSPKPSLRETIRVHSVECGSPPGVSGGMWVVKHLLRRHHNCQTQLVEMCKVLNKVFFV